MWIACSPLLLRYMLCDYKMYFGGLWRGKPRRYRCFALPALRSLPFALNLQEKWSWELFRHLRQQGVDGRVLKVDGSHKYVKLVRVFESGGAGRTKPAHCIITFFNEFEQVRVCSWGRLANLSVTACCVMTDCCVTGVF